MTKEEFYKKFNQLFDELKILADELNNKQNKK